MQYQTDDYEGQYFLTIDELGCDRMGRDGLAITISKQLDGEQNYKVLFDREVYAESEHAALTSAFCEIGWSYDDANIQANEWGWYSLQEMGLAYE